MDWVTSFPRGLRFTCTRCGLCCRHVGVGVGLTPSDDRRLNSAKREAVSHPIYVKRLRAEKGTCLEFNAVDSACRVYDSRPAACRLYPFYLSFTQGGRLLVSIEHCPGVNSPEAELVDDQYVETKIFGEIRHDGYYLDKLRSETLKMRAHPIVLIGKNSDRVYSDWEGRGHLWNYALRAITHDSPVPPSKSIRAFQVDVLPRLVSRFKTFGGSLLAGEAVRSIVVELSNSSSSLPILRQGCEGGVEIEAAEGLVMETLQGRKFFRRGEKAQFTTRLGEEFSVAVDLLLKGMPLSRNARRCEIRYIEEVVRRDGVHSGLVQPPLPFESELEVLARVADALEFRATAFAASKNLLRIDEGCLDMAIVEVDAYVPAFYFDLARGGTSRI